VCRSKTHGKEGALLCLRETHSKRRTSKTNGRLLQEWRKKKNLWRASEIKTHRKDFVRHKIRRATKILCRAFWTTHSKQALCRGPHKRHTAKIWTHGEGRVSGSGLSTRQGSQVMCHVPCVPLARLGCSSMTCFYIFVHVVTSHLHLIVWSRSLFLLGATQAAWPEDRTIFFI
jgi:hypothetical protein